jgi:hypothetical protein
MSGGPVVASTDGKIIGMLCASYVSPQQGGQVSWALKAQNIEQAVDRAKQVVSSPGLFATQ